MKICFYHKCFKICFRKCDGQGLKNKAGQDFECNTSASGLTPKMLIYCADTNIVKRNKPVNISALLTLV